MSLQVSNLTSKDSLSFSFGSHSSSFKHFGITHFALLHAMGQASSAVTLLLSFLTQCFPGLFRTQPQFLLYLPLCFHFRSSVQKKIVGLFVGREVVGETVGLFVGGEVVGLVVGLFVGVVVGIVVG